MRFNEKDRVKLCCYKARKNRVKNEKYQSESSVDMEGYLI